jgi:quercetin dioxygenase-like cupin family protein
MLKRMSAVAAVAATFVVAGAMAQTPIKRTPLQNTEFPPGFVTVTAIAEVSGPCAGRHTHPGIETSYVMDGELVLKVEGKPDQTFKPGDSFTVPANTPHDACVVGGKPFKILAAYIVEKGKPLATPAP